MKGGIPEGFRGKIARVWGIRGGQGLLDGSREMELFLSWPVQCGVSGWGRRDPNKAQSSELGDRVGVPHLVLLPSRPSQGQEGRIQVTCCGVSPCPYCSPPASWLVPATLAFSRPWFRHGQVWTLDPVIDESSDVYVSEPPEPLTM